MAVIPGGALLSVDGTSFAGSRATRGCAGPSRTRARRRSASPVTRGTFPASTHALRALCACGTARAGAPSARLGVVVAWMVRFPGSSPGKRGWRGLGWRGLTVLPDSAIPPDAMGEVLDARAIEGSGDLGVLRSSSDFCAHVLVAAGLQCPRVTRRTLIRCSVPSVRSDAPEHPG